MNKGPLYCALGGIIGLFVGPAICAALIQGFIILGLTDSSPRGTGSLVLGIISAVIGGVSGIAIAYNGRQE